MYSQKLALTLYDPGASKQSLYDPGIPENALLTPHEPRNKAFCELATSPVDRYVAS